MEQAIKITANWFEKIIKFIMIDLNTSTYQIKNN